ENNYRYNFGGSTTDAGSLDWNDNTAMNALGNGAFTMGAGLRAADYSDGLSNTAFFSEHDKGSGLDMSTQLPTKNDMITSPNRQTSGAVNPDAHMVACASPAGHIVSSFNF